MKTLAVMVFAVWGSACGAIPTVEDPGMDGSVVVDLSSREQLIGDWVVEGAQPAAPGAVAGAVPRQGAVGTTCAIVQFCDVPGPDGTRCVQNGCSIVQALSECSVEAPRECGHIVCPFVFVAPGGKRFLNGACF